MFRLFFCGLIFLVSFTPLSAQISTDSILIDAQGIKDETARLEALEKAVVSRTASEFDDPFTLFRVRWLLAKEVGNFQREISAALDLIRAGNFVGSYAFADSLSFVYVEEAERVELPRKRVSIYHEAAKAAFFSQAYQQAIDYDSAALQLLPVVEPASDRDSIASSLQNYLGKSFNASGRFVEAATILTDAIELARNTRQDTALLIELFTELGIVYSQIGLYDRAVNYLDQTKQFGSYLSPPNFANLSINTGRNLLLTKAYPAARDRYLEALAIPLKEPNQLLFRPYILNGLVEAYFRLKDRDSVNYYYQAFTDFLQENPAQKEVNSFLFQQSTWLHHLENNQLNAASEIGENLLEKARQSQDQADLLFYTELLADTYRRQGNYQLADLLSQELISRKDSVQSANKTNALLLYYNEFETKEKENEILRLDAERAEISASRRLFRTAAGLLGLLLLTGLYFFFKLRKARTELASQNTQLGKLNATKDRFFGIIAHDLRNPIAALKTADRQVTWLYERGRTDDVKSVVGSISETASQLSGLLDNLLKWALSQSDTIELNRTDLKLQEATNEIIELYKPAAELQSIRLNHTIDPDLTILADYNALQTILRNLVGNAVKFTPADEGKEILITYRKEGSFNVISVQDEGPGLTEEVRSKLFQLKGDEVALSRQPGTGLGLVLCRDLAELHGGRIEVDSTLGKGSVFAVWLPSS